MHIEEMESANGSILFGQNKLASTNLRVFTQFRNIEMTIIPLLLVQQKN